jgi:hypothetical protein
MRAVDVQVTQASTAWRVLTSGISNRWRVADRRSPTRQRHVLSRGLSPSGAGQPPVPPERAVLMVTHQALGSSADRPRREIKCSRQVRDARTVCGLHASETRGDDRLRDASRPYSDTDRRDDTRVPIARCPVRPRIEQRVRSQEGTLPIHTARRQAGRLDSFAAHQGKPLMCISSRGSEASCLR